MHFLRVNIDEITRVGLSNRQVADTQSFNGDGATDVFTLTNQPVCINSVTVGGVVQTIYLHYEIDIDNKKIKFNAGYIPAVGTNNIVVSFDKTATWIYPDKPRDELSKSSFPRIGVISLTENSTDMGMGETDTYDELVFQIDVVGYKDQKCQVGSDTIADSDVVQYLARDVIKKLKRNRSQLFNALYDVKILNNYPTPFENDKHIVRRIIEVKFNTTNAGE